MWPAPVRYAPARAGAACETCGRPFTCGNSAVSCERCQSISCRKCFSRSCAFEVGGVIVALPMVIGRQAVCDGCRPDCEREAAFVDKHLPYLKNGVLVQKGASGALASLLTVAGSSAGGKDPIMLALDIDGRKFTWKTMQLVNQQPKDKGEISLAEVGNVIGISANGDIPASGASEQPPTGLRLMSPRGVTLLVVTCTEARQAKLLLEAVKEAVAVSRLPHCSIFPSSGSVAQRTASDSAAAAREQSSADARAGTDSREK